VGTQIYLRGELVGIEAPNSHDQSPENIQIPNIVRIGMETLKVKDLKADLRPAIERHLRAVASRELPVRVMELAAKHQLLVQRVTVRNQRSRWGSCSRRATISLNWRLVQTPDFVRDYIILHELAHLREMNHSHQFWREVERLCPEYREAEKWLKANRQLLR
jgi:predicted metal-dependent hydrolase